MVMDGSSVFSSEPEPELLCVQVTHSITLLTLVHQNIYNSLTLLVSVLTRCKSDKGEEVGWWVAL